MIKKRRLILDWIKVSIEVKDYSVWFYVKQRMTIANTIKECTHETSRLIQRDCLNYDNNKNTKETNKTKQSLLIGAGNFNLVILNLKIKYKN